MKPSRNAAFSAFAALAISVAGVGTAQAADPDAPANPVAEQIAKVAPNADSENRLSADVADVHTEIPSNAAAPVTIGSSSPGVPDLTVRLPKLDNLGAALRADDGTVVYESGSDASLAIQTFADGGTRFLSVLENNEADSRYDYRFEGTDLKLEEDGSASILLEGEDIGTVDAPWAYDANGNEVPTHFEVSDETLTQVISHEKGNFEYPIVADPKVTHTWWNQTVYFNKMETGVIAGGSTIAAILLAKVPFVGGILAAGAGTLVGLAQIYLAQGKCLKVVVYSAPLWLPQPYSGAEAGGYCR